MPQSHHLSDEMLSLLTACPVFEGLKLSELTGLLEKSSCRINDYKNGEVVARAGDEVHFQRIVISGSVKGEMVDFAGKVIKIEDIMPPRPLAAAFLFGNQNRYPVNIIANEPTRILSIPKDSFLKMMQDNGLVLKNFLHAVSSRGQFLSNKIRFLSFTTIKGKLVQYMFDLSRKQGGDKIILPISQSQLSELFGVTRPSIGRAISELNHDGLIRTDGKRVTLLDKAGLSSLLK
ncbi:MAG: Crp/Fnr family transcriptional regulator [Bacteroidetes bacterium]|nr:Crp/Fnr family transcriptional regulator [Bacteroidota bacterium]